jgi:hypothetical protein
VEGFVNRVSRTFRPVFRLSIGKQFRRICGEAQVLFLEYVHNLLATMKRISTHAALFLFAAVIGSGCSSTSQPPAQTYPSKMTFTQGESTTYQMTTLDTTAGEPKTGNYSTTTSTQVASNMPWKSSTGQSMNAQIEENRDSLGSISDSGFYSQDANLDLWALGFGVSQSFQMVNMLGTAFGFQLPDPGWTLLVKMGSAKGTSWNPYDYATSQTVTVPGFPLPVKIDIQVTDVGTMQSDTTFSLGGNTYGVKHAQHVFSLAATNVLLGSIASFSRVIDTYVSGDLGATVMTVTHPSNPPTISAALQAVIGASVPSKKTRGSVLVMASHK